MTLSRSSTVDELTSVLGQKILTGQLPPGQPLREAEFADHFAVSRNTLREAFHLLAREGLVTHRPHRGVTVTELTPAAIGEVYRIRRVLELAGLRSGNVRGAALKEAAAGLEEAANLSEWDRLVEWDFEFHARLVAGLQSARLEAFFGGLLRELRLAFLQIDRRKDARPEAPSHVPDHTLIARSVDHGDIEGATRLLSTHLDAAEALLREHLESPKRWSEKPK